MKKRLDFCEKIINMKLEGKNIFFTDETKIDMAPNISNESIRVSSRIKNKSKKEIKKATITLIERQKSMSLLLY